MPGTVTGRATPREHIISPSGHLAEWPTAQWVWDSPEASTLWASHLADPLGRHGPNYWNLTGDLFTEMSVAEKDAVDTAEAVALEADILAALDAEPEADVLDVGEGIGPRVRALIKVNNQRINYLTNRVVEIQDTLVAIREQTFGVQARHNILPGFPIATGTRNLRQAIDQYKLDLVTHKNPEP